MTRLIGLVFKSLNPTKVTKSNQTKNKTKLSTHDIQLQEYRLVDIYTHSSSIF